ncbi:MAG: hypothetical protein AAB434_02355 [Planctomycetota bacterium]
MRLQLLALALAGAVLLPACIKDETVIKLNPDGSGTLEKTTTMSKEIVKQIEEMTKGMGGGEGGAKAKEPFSEDEAKADAAKMGEGVTFVSWEKVETETAIGQKAVYAFTDISKVTLSQDPKNPNEGMGPGGGGEEKKKPITFKFEGGDTSKVTVVFPPPDKKPEAEGEGEGEGEVEGDATPPAGEEKEPSPEEMEQAKMFFKDMKISIVVEAGSEVVSTNSLFVEGTRVTLVEMDFGALMENMDMFKEMAKKKPKSMEETKELLKDVKGFKVNPDPEITIEFK